MEFGVPLKLPKKGTLVGLGWGAAPYAGGESQVISTGSSRVETHSPNDDRITHNWLSPKTGQHFTTKAVQHLRSRRFYCVQDHTRVVSWGEEESLEAARSCSVRSEVLEVIVHRDTKSVIVVCADGSVATIGQRMTVTAECDSPDEGSRAVWCHAECTRATGDSVTNGLVFVLRSKDSKWVLDTFVVSIPSEPASETTLTLSSSHVVEQPRGDLVGSTKDIQFVGAALNARVRRLSVVWTSGVWCIYRFPKQVRWWDVAPSLRAIRVAAGSNAVASSSGSRSKRAAPKSAPSTSAYIATAALGPSCVILATRDSEGTVDLTVWDVRYGVLLSSVDLPGVHAGAGAISVAAASGPAKRTRRRSRTGSVASTASVSVDGGAGSGDASASPLAKLEVSDDLGFVGLVLPSATFAVPLAARAATLLTAIGKMGDTQAKLSKSILLRRGEGSEAKVADCLTEHICAGVLDMKTCLMSRADDGVYSVESTQIGASTWDAESEVAWTRLVDAWHKKETHAVDGASVKAARTAQDLTKLIDEYLRSTSGAGPRESRKRGHGLTGPKAASQQFVLATVTRCVSNLDARDPKKKKSRKATEDYSIPLAKLLKSRRVSAAACPALIPRLMATQQLDLLEDTLNYVSDVPESTLIKIFRFVACKANPTVAKRFVSVRCDNATLSAAKGSDGDVSTEVSTRFITHFVCLIVRASRNDVFLENALRNLAPAEVALLLATLMRLVRVFATHFIEEKRPLPASALAVLKRIAARKAEREALAEVARFKRDQAGGGGGGGGGSGSARQSKGDKDGEDDKKTSGDVKGEEKGEEKSDKGAHAPARKLPLKSGGVRSTPLPSFAQVLDWTRMVTDAHFSQLVMSARGNKRMRELIDELHSLAESQVHLCESFEGLRGHLMHIINREPLPVVPIPDYSIEVVRL